MDGTVVSICKVSEKREVAKGAELRPLAGGQWALAVGAHVSTSRFTKYCNFLKLVLTRLVFIYTSRRLIKQIASPRFDDGRLVADCHGTQLVIPAH
jgi:hypothetical protein